VQRDENRTRVFQGRPAVPDRAAAESRIDGLGLSAAQRARWLAILDALLNAEPTEGIAADDLARLPAFADGPEGGPVPLWDRGETAGQRVLRTLHDMAGAGLLHGGPQLSAFVRHRVRDSSKAILERVAALERAMLEALREASPDAATGVWLPLSLRRLNQQLLDQGLRSSPEQLRALLKSLSLDGRGLAGSRGSLDLRQSDRDHYRLRLHRDWPTLVRTAERRRAVAALVLRVLLAKLPADVPASAELLVSFGTEELTEALRGDMALAAEIRDPLAATERGLMFLHEQGAIILHGGFAVFRSAMTVRLLPEAKGRSYTKAQYQPLAQHYGERVFQIHVMDRYARLGAERIRQALGLVTAYFTLGKEAFVRRFFADRREMLARATTAESFRRIVESLGSPAQTEIVAATEDGNRLVLAGPGSGKTRVIVHRCAYLLRVLRVPAHRILVLCFNRSAALELRRRLSTLVGDDARGVTVQTYHGLAMRLLGRSFAETLDHRPGLRSGSSPLVAGPVTPGPAAGRGAAPTQAEETEPFDALIGEAAELLEGRVDLPGIEPDAVRERLLAGYRHILVDEYQDIDAAQYRLIAAIAGRSGDESRLTLLAVGDDDQSIYAFRGASVTYIGRFREDYAAELHHLVENYRSSGHIIAAANGLIAHNRGRMKGDRPIRIDRHRADLPAGGRWAGLDRYTQGRVLIAQVADPACQAAALVARIRELRRLGGDGWDAFAVLARRHDVLGPVRALCEAAGVPVRLSGELPPLHRVREVDAFLRALKEQGREPIGLDALRALLPERLGPWRGLLGQLVDDWAAEAGFAEVPAIEVAELCWETLAEQRRERSIGEGVLLTTLHGAKGLEFPHVLIADGGWDRDAASEDERRLFYVGMTRARETLTLLELAGAGNPHIPLIPRDPALRTMPVVEAPPAAILARRYTRLTLTDLDLGFAGRQPPDAPIHRHLAAVQAGDAVGWRRSGDDLLLTDAGGEVIARLSKRAAAAWRPRLERIEQTRVLAVLRRDRAQGEAELAQRCRCERWEVPLPEIRWR
jgi:ATP-dependent DNA helicase RecQ